MAKKKTYVAVPSVSEAQQPRYQAVVEVLSGQTSVSEAARRLNLSRNHFQTLMHRGLSGLLEKLEPQPPGRPAKPEAQMKLEEKVERLERENEMLRARVATVDRLLGVAADFAKGRLKPSRQMGAKAETAEKADEPAEPDGARLGLVREASSVREAGLELGLVARAAEVAPSTLRRWRRRYEASQPLVNRRGPRPTAGPADHPAAEEVVRSMKGQIGAAALAKCSEGLSRRQAAALKSRVLTAMENERQAALTRIYLAPGAVRGFDAMYVPNGFLLISADAGVPYRTAIEHVGDYVGPLVAEVLDQDFATNGAPLVMRFDRAKQHLTDEVNEVLVRHVVLPLHGPPRHPGFYGQLERQNREHRAFVGNDDVSAADAVQMRHAFNEVLPRRRLGWRTAGAAWRERKPLDVDRRVFRDEVAEISAKLKQTREAQAWCWGTAERFAIEAALKRRGLLKAERSGGC